MLYQIASKKSLDDIDEALMQSAARHQFGIIALHDLKETMKRKGVFLAKDCLIYEVCNPHQAKKVLDANGAVSTALPCRISVYGSEGAYKLATILPTALMSMFDSPELEPVAREVEEVVKKIMQEAA